MICVFLKDLGNASVIILLWMGQVDRQHVKIQFEQYLELGGSVLLIEVVYLVTFYQYLTPSFDTFSITYFAIRSNDPNRIPFAEDTPNTTNKCSKECDEFVCCVENGDFCKLVQCTVAFRAEW